MDTYGEDGSPYSAEYDWLGEVDPKPKGAGFYYLDHLTHTHVQRGNMSTWYDFYAKAFNFREIRYFDIKGQADRPVLARADLTPGGKIRIPIKPKSADETSPRVEE